MLKPGTSATAVLPFINQVEMILVMTVEPGFGGQKFMADQMKKKLGAVRGLIDTMNPQCELEVDGGIDPDTAPTAIEAGANVLVAGSAVYGAGRYRRAHRSPARRLNKGKGQRRDDIPWNIFPHL